MTATRIVLAGVFALLLAAPAQALGEEDDKVFRQCLEAWPDDQPKMWDCISEAIAARESERHKGLTPQEIRELRVETLMESFERMLMESHEQSIKRERFLDSPPLQCADAEAEGLDMPPACETEELNIADAPPVQPK